MMAIPVRKPTMGVSSFEKNGNLTLSCGEGSSFPCGFLISRKPVFGICLKTRKVKQNSVFSSKTCSCLVVNVLSKGESASRLPNCEFLEKDFEFKPAFDEYLKTMESIRTGRDMKQANCSDRKRAKVDDLRWQSSWGFEENVSLGDRSEGQKCLKKSESPKQQELNKNSEAVTSLGLANGSAKLKVTGEMGLKGKGYSRAEQSFNQDELISRETEANLNVKKRFETNRTNLRWIKNQKGGELSSERASYKSLGLRKLTARKEHMSKKSNYEEMERAAFKPFEESIDVLDKPRVSRMEMEERIQKLANWYVFHNLGMRSTYLLHVYVLFFIVGGE